VREYEEDNIACVKSVFVCVCVCVCVKVNVGEKEVHI
jgi:hypothetical protein